MDRWTNYFATTGSELDIREALISLERVLAEARLDPCQRIALEAAASVLREIEATAAVSPLVATPETQDFSGTS